MPWTDVAQIEGVLMNRFLPTLGMIIFACGLPGCRLECLGDGPTTFDAVKLVPQAVQSAAGGSPISTRVDSQVQCPGQGNKFLWSLEPAVVKIELTADNAVVNYRPPETIEAATDVKIVVRFEGYGQNKKADASVRVVKP